MTELKKGKGLPKNDALTLDGCYWDDRPAVSYRYNFKQSSKRKYDRIQKESSRF
ncbi:hypothetical protein LMANV2_150141 [Leptospira interrogans serovar Manilae]|uniref:Uncharacterized protein n=1 Tax=Leptospira interrogans serovar Manilae TaxID=214675 RepID=A0AAQ1SMH4_LEPIR|nr:hypothetical protein LMANV2_150141 [Leptospira interrogans serovar Manilae]